jgi:hypothetical protein
VNGGTYLENWRFVDSYQDRPLSDANGVDLAISVAAFPSLKRLTVRMSAATRGSLKFDKWGVVTLVEREGFEPVSFCRPQKMRATLVLPSAKSTNTGKP